MNVRKIKWMVLQHLGNLFGNYKAFPSRKIFIFETGNVLKHSKIALRHFYMFEKKSYIYFENSNQFLKSFSDINISLHEPHNAMFKWDDFSFRVADPGVFSGSEPDPIFS